ncbi:hypothetical protein PGT21_020493 [Puccinia graminis f. sp. tritici]|uniref:Secreted protein n=1 Tax=Puccinia graminis f. sp. tritici TaxID=56615 RepID=A0A5B0PKZ0_PUCGR|nr:hypothetical protein PGT21_020493 [Puccinia graminis f. sp. tritici]
MFHQKLITLAGIAASLTLTSVTAPPEEYRCPAANCVNNLTITWCNHELPRCNRHRGMHSCPVPLVGRCLPTFNGESMVNQGCGSLIRLNSHDITHKHGPIKNCQECCAQQPSTSQTV